MRNLFAYYPQTNLRPQLMNLECPRLAGVKLALCLPLVSFATVVTIQQYSETSITIKADNLMPGSITTLQQSADLLNWVSVDQETASSLGASELSAAITPGQPRGFYRVVAEPAPRRNSVVQIECSEDQVPHSLNVVTEIPQEGIPQANQGAEYTQLNTSIQPTKVGNKLIIEAEVTTQTHIGNGAFVVAALFQDGQASALATAAESQQSTNLGGEAGGSTHLVRLRHVVTVTSTTPTTYMIRLSNSGSSPVQVNSKYYGGTFGGTLVSSMVVTEVQQ